MNKKITKIIIVVLALFVFAGKYKTIDAQDKSISIDEVLNKKIFEWERKVEEEMSRKVVYPDVKNLTKESSGFWNWRPGIICIDNSETSRFEHGHAAIVAPTSYGRGVIEAVPEGVRFRAGEWTKGKVWQVSAKATSIQEDEEVSIWAANKIGSPYHYNYLDTSTRDRFYCSHLVWAAFKDVAGIDIGSGRWLSIILPYELMNDNYTRLVYRNH